MFPVRFSFAVCGSEKRVWCKLERRFEMLKVHYIYAGFLAVVVLAGAFEAAVAVGSEYAVTIDAGKTSEPISKFIYGQFIEHLGRCIYGGIWAEMLEARKFYFPITVEYAPYRDLTDTPFPVVGASPWQIIGLPNRVSIVTKDAFVGRHTLHIQPGNGVRQCDLAVIEDKDYVGHIWLAAGTAKAETSAEVSLVWGGGKARQTVEINKLKGAYRKYSLRFTAHATTDKAMLEVFVKGGDVLVGTVSLMPADNVRGMRADTLRLLKQLGATKYRWPGGNFVSGYDWRDGLGDRDRRPPRKNPARDR